LVVSRRGSNDSLVPGFFSRAGAIDGESAHMVDVDHLIRCLIAANSVKNGQKLRLRHRTKRGGRFFQSPKRSGRSRHADAGTKSIQNRFDKQSVVGRRAAHMASRPGRKS